MRILVAEDDLVSRTLLKHTLAKFGYEVESVEDGEAAWNLLRRPDTPKLAILDWMMPGMDGLALCRKIRQREDGEYIYVIILTALDQKENLVEAIEAGADDYIAKPFDPRELQARLRAARRIVELQADLLAAQETLRIQATHDSLTGLLNRAAIMSRLAEELSRSRRTGETVGVILADIDDFKKINDNYGHLIGDATLRGAAARTRSAVRSYDAVGRYGGEELLIVVPGCTALDAREAAERVRESFCEPIVTESQEIITVSISLGVTAVEGRREVSADLLLREADQALYMAKALGKNRVDQFPIGRGESQIPAPPM